MIHFCALVGCVRMKASSKRSSGVRFGQFELDLFEERLLKKGFPVRLENQPFQILATLVDRPGEMVSREELCAIVWPDGTYVDFDEGLNTAVKKLRYALGDSAESPIFIETVPRRGYRFIAPITRNGDSSVLTSAATSAADASGEELNFGRGNGEGAVTSSPSNGRPLVSPSSEFEKRRGSLEMGSLCCSGCLCGTRSRLFGALKDRPEPTAELGQVSGNEAHRQRESRIGCHFCGRALCMLRATRSRALRSLAVPSADAQRSSDPAG